MPETVSHQVITDDRQIWLPVLLHYLLITLTPSAHGEGQPHRLFKQLLQHSAPQTYERKENAHIWKNKPALQTIFTTFNIVHLKRMKEKRTRTIWKNKSINVSHSFSFFMPPTVVLYVFITPFQDSFFTLLCLIARRF